MRTLLLLIFSIMLEVASGQALLDGKTFSIKLKISGKERPGIKWSKDELAFSKESFTCKFMGKAENFSPFDYTSRFDTTEKETIDFTATGENPSGSTIVWEGKVTGDKIEGTATWTNIHGPQKQIFNGTLIEKNIN